MIDFDERSPLLEKAYREGSLTDSEFREVIQSFLISKDGWVLDTGSGDNVNAEVALRFMAKVREHPHLWTLFMVA